MLKHIAIGIAVLLVSTTAARAEEKKKASADSGELYATFKTSLGDIEVKLFEKDAPKTVANFVGLAKGDKDWTHPTSNKPQKARPLYNGTYFHRVIPGFMIQG